MSLPEQDFLFDLSDDLADLGGPERRYRHNLTALQLLRRLDAEQRPATRDEQRALSHYTGWGDSQVLKLAFPPRARWQDASNAPASDEIAALDLSDDEIRSLRASSLNAHYTALLVVRAIWQALEHLGLGKLDTIRCLEPSVGIGHFFSAMPRELHAKSQRVAVELDALTAGILKHLQPNTRVYAAGFEEVALPNNYFDLVVSNVPFGDYPVSDPAVKDKFLRASIHNYFICRAVSLLQPGGFAAIVTSRYTADQTDDRVRRWLLERADLLGTVRLPETAFARNAGTEVVTDVIFLRKRDGEESRGVKGWIELGTLALPDHFGRETPVPINQVFVDHPEWMLGTPALSSGMYRDDEFTVQSDGRDLGTAMTEVLLSILPADIVDATTESEDRADLPAETISARTLFVLPGDANFEQRERVAGTQTIYETAKHLLASEIADAPAADIAAQRARLNEVYDRFSARFGCLNGPSNLKALKDSPALPFLKALEVNFDPLTNSANKADLFTHSTVRAKARMLATDGDADPIQRAHEALLLSLDRYGAPDLDYIARLIGDTREGAIKKLAGRIFRTPVGDWQTAEEYLSGDVRAKLRQTEAAAALDPQFKRNVDALRAVQPEPLGPGEITARLGAGWIPADVVEQFLRDTLARFDGRVTYVLALAQWTIEISKSQRWALDRVELSQRWGTPRRDALELVEDALNLRQPLIFDIVDEGRQERRILNQTETVAIQAKLAEIKDHFASWVWQDGERSQRLCAIYNDQYNHLRPRRYDGSHLSLPGLNAAIQLRPHQKDAIWRAVQSKATLLGHVVGAGKTLIGVCATMELKRLGLAHKALVAVPNHLTEQWLHEALHAYPNANVLCASKDDLSKARRGEFLSRVATNAWDLVIVPHSSFKLLPVNPQTKAAFLRRELAQLEDYLYELKQEGRSTRTAKEIEKAKKRLEVKLKDLGAMRKDSADTVTWEELGIDLLICDEFHQFKNLFFATKMTRVAGLPNSNSERAFDMFVKLRWLLDHGGRAICATGTPVSNTLAEVFSMMRYLQLELLEEKGIAHFDAWAQLFAEAVPQLEMTPDGSGFRMNMRFAKFTNLPELATLWRQVLDVRNAEQLNLPRPKLYRGKPVIVKLSGSPQLKAYVKDLARRVERIKRGEVPPWKDNMLRITGDGRKAALDLRLVKPDAPDLPTSKINVLVNNVVAIWRGSELNHGAQLIFCDIGTPKRLRADMDNAEEETAELMEDGLALQQHDVETSDEQRLMCDVYGDIKRKLVHAGMPAHEVAFIHDAKTPAQRSELFAAVRKGRVRVLIGSTEKMGTGMNCQTRLIGLHHLGAGWRPSDQAQRDGRILRQGNTYPEVLIFNYITEGSFDGFCWQVLESKARFIEQIMAGEITARTAEDVGDTVLTMAEVKALASGNPKVMHKVAVETELTKLSHLYAAWRSEQSTMRWELTGMPERIKAAEHTLDFHMRAKALRDAHADEDFVIQLRTNLDSDNLVTFDKREVAGKRLRLLAEMGYQKLRRSADATMQSHHFFEVGEYKGFWLFLKSFANEALVPELWPALGEELAQSYAATIGDSDLGAIQSLEAQLRGIDKKLNEAGLAKERLIAQEQSMRAELGKPWEHTEKYARLKRQLAVLNVELQQAGVDPGSATVLPEVAAAGETMDTAPTAESPATTEPDMNFSLDEIVAWLRELHCGLPAKTSAVQSEQHVSPMAQAGTTAPVIDEVTLAAMEREIEAKQAQLVFGQMVLQTSKKPKKVVVESSEAQMGFDW
jgi:N12 class adenine-specific DNA methylase